MFSIVIPTCNRPHLLRKCLDALHPSVQNVESEYELIVSDDSHDDETKLFLEKEYDWVKWVKGPRNGIGANRNNGAKLAKYDWIIFIDDDAIPNDALISNYFDAISKNPDVKAFEGCILPENEQLMENEFAECPVNITGGHFWTANVCINRKLFQKIRGFDENLKFFHEDQDLYDRLKELTFILFIKNSIVIHPVSITSLRKRMKKSNKAYTDYQIYMLKKNTHIQIIKKSYRFHLTSIKTNLINKKWSMVILSFYNLLWIIPSNILKKQ